MTYQNPRAVLQDQSLLSVEREDGSVVILEKGVSDDYNKAAAGEFGSIAPFVPEPALSADDLLARERAAMVVSKFQAKAALMQAGLLDGIEVFLETADPIVKLAWTDATEFRRQSPSIAALASGAGLTDDMLDDLFRAAAQIEA